MCKKTLHFHIGSHKTATTTLQNALAANDDLLARTGLLYPKSGRYFSGHHPLALQLQDPDLRHLTLDALGDWPAVQQEINASPCDHVLLSSENFEWLQNLSRLQDLTRHYHVRVIFYMRHPASYLESFYNQLVKDLKTRESRSLETYICEHGLFFLDTDKLLRRWSEAFGVGALQVRLYEPAQPPEALLSQFFSTLGCQSPPPLVMPQTPALQKISLPPDALEYLRLRNLHRTPSKGQHRITMTLAQIARTCPAAAQLSCLHRTRAGQLSRAAQQNLIKRFAPGNLRVARAYLGSERPPFDPEQVQGHADFDSRLAVGDDVMISKVETLLSRFAQTPPASAQVDLEQRDPVQTGAVQTDSIQTGAIRDAPAPSRAAPPDLAPPPVDAPPSRAALLSPPTG